MRSLHHHLAVYKKFIAGGFLVRKSPVIVNATFMDVKLLKAIQYSQKSVGSIKEKAIRKLSQVP